MKSIFSAISMFDFMSYNHLIRYKGNSSHKTCFGGVISMLVFCLFGFGFFYFGREMVERKNPTMLQSTSIAQQTPIPFKNLGFMFGFTHSSGELYHFKEDFMASLQITPILVDFLIEDGKPKTVYNYLIFEQCTDDHFSPEIATELKKNYTLETFLCINPNKLIREGKIIEEEVVIYNSWSKPGSRNFWLNIRICNEAEKPGCSQWIKDNTDFFLLGTIIDYFLNPQNENQPIQPNFRILNTFIGNQLGILDRVLFKMNKLTLDSGYIFQVEDNDQFVSFGEKESTMQIFDPKHPNIYDLMFSTSEAQVFWTRRYVKLQEIIANVGGFFKALIIILGSFVKLIGEFYFLDSFELIQTVKAKEETVKRVRFGSNLNSSEVRLDNKQKSLNLKNHFGFLAYLKARFGFKSSKSTDFSKTVYLQFDVEHYMKKFKELDQLKEQVYSAVSE